jgi:hypothetical protein
VWLRVLLIGMRYRVVIVVPLSSIDVDAESPIGALCHARHATMPLLGTVAIQAQRMSNLGWVVAVTWRRRRVYELTQEECEPAADMIPVDG